MHLFLWGYTGLQYLKSIHAFHSTWNIALALAPLQGDKSTHNSVINQYFLVAAFLVSFIKTFYFRLQQNILIVRQSLEYKQSSKSCLSLSPPPY